MYKPAYKNTIYFAWNSDGKEGLTVSGIKSVFHCIDEYTRSLANPSHS